LPPPRFLALLLLLYLAPLFSFLTPELDSIFPCEMTNTNNGLLSHLALLAADCSLFHELRALALARELCCYETFTPPATTTRLLSMRMFHCFLCNDVETFLSFRDFPLLSETCLDLHELSRFLLEDMSMEHERRLLLGTNTQDNESDSDPWGDILFNNSSH
jgi:hypothetical protein